MRKKSTVHKLEITQKTCLQNKSEARGKMVIIRGTPVETLRSKYF